jgi:hypothetical protein
MTTSAESDHESLRTPDSVAYGSLEWTSLVHSIAARPDIRKAYTDFFAVFAMQAFAVGIVQILASPELQSIWDAEGQALADLCTSLAPRDRLKLMGELIRLIISA